jgi:hypothetical protein
MYDEDSIDEVYYGEGRVDLVTNDEISAEEEAFMNGYDEEHASSETTVVDDKMYDEAFNSKRRSRRSKSGADFDIEELEADALIR